MSKHDYLRKSAFICGARLNRTSMPKYPRPPARSW